MLRYSNNPLDNLNLAVYVYPINFVENAHASPPHQYPQLQPFRLASKKVFANQSGIGLWIADRGYHVAKLG